MSVDKARAREFASALGASVPRVRELYLVGSRATGSARPDSDWDLVALVDGRLARPGFRAPGRCRVPGFPRVLDGQPVDWCLLRSRDFDREDLEAGGAVRLWGREGG